VKTMNPLVLERFTATSCIGTGLGPTLASLAAQRSGLAHCKFETVTIDTHIGEVSGVDAQPLPAQLRIFDCRNNRLAELALRQDGTVAAWGRYFDNGNDIEAVIDACAMAKSITEKPVVIIAYTIPGKGVDFMENDYHWHGSPPNHEQAVKALHELRTLGGKIRSEHE